MADNLQSGMAQPKLFPGMKVVLEAVDPATGVAIAGVTISQVVISGDPIGAADLEELLSELPAWVWGGGDG